MLHHSWKLNKNSQIITVEKFDIPKSEKQCQEKLKEMFLKQKNLTDVRVIDMLVIKGQMELKEVSMQWKQKGHVMVREIKILRSLKFLNIHILDLLARHS